MEHDLISERTLDGLDARPRRRQGLADARLRSPTTCSPWRGPVAACGQLVIHIARELGVGRSTLYRALEGDDQGSPMV
ncbi:hypothetical protein ACFFV7_38310 [Nonomuraea spiralis]|uniref:Resolvase HTH domain-containing protein n=1 Tax=Nonomuraea spiralis TaxID=46182 RepID=A0ABV5IT55_9ACTN|nr:hypothetical protein [Nonomuraea spiralis]GGT43096.1 hypothetical protein GCM10010176_103280 [Nonomuraea spiralis]